MKKALFVSISLICILCLFFGCGKKSQAEIASDKFVETAELYSSLAPTVGGIGDNAVAADFSRWGDDLEGYGTQLESAESLPSRELDAIIRELDTIYEGLLKIKEREGDIS